MATINNSINNTCLNGITVEGGNVNVSTDGVASSLNLGTGAAVKQITVGSVNSTSFTAIQSGSSGLSLHAANGSVTATADTTIGMTGTTGVTLTATNNPISLHAGTGDINIGDDGAVSHIYIGNASSPLATQKNITIGNGAAGSGVIISAADPGGISIDSNNGTLGIESGTGTLGISTFNTGTTVNIGTGVGNKSITIGSTTGTSFVDINFGSGGFNILPFTAGAVVSSAAGLITSTNGTAGQVLTANSSGIPTFQDSSVTVIPITTTAASTYVVMSGDQFIAADSSSHPVTIQLPNAPTTGRIYTIKDINGTSTANNITVTTVGGSVGIDNSTTYVMNTNYQSINVIFNGIGYMVY